MAKYPNTVSKTPETGVTNQEADPWHGTADFLGSLAARTGVRARAPRVHELLLEFNAPALLSHIVSAAAQLIILADLFRVSAF
jgi:hypothetical protein